MPVIDASRPTGKPYHRDTFEGPIPVGHPTTPELPRRDPSLPTTSSSKTPFKPFDEAEHVEKEDVPFHKRCCRFFYDSKNRTICGRTFIDWIKMTVYSIMYLMFLTTFTMILLYISLTIIKSGRMNLHDIEELTYSPNLIGLTAIPVAEHNYPLIWYRNGEYHEFQKYVNALDKLLKKKREKREFDSDLGPCGRHPYGYGENPCIVVKINKQWKWNAKPLKPDSPKAKAAPLEVQKWLQRDAKKFWLHCKGYHSYDREHIGRIRYYPDPPGFDSALFPLDKDRSSPLVAIQFSNFTLGISLAIECSLWYENGESNVSFMLYVTPKSRFVKNETVITAIL